MPTKQNALETKKQYDIEKAIEKKRLAVEKAIEKRRLYLEQRKQLAMEKFKNDLTIKSEKQLARFSKTRRNKLETFEKKLK